MIFSVAEEGERPIISRIISDSIRRFEENGKNTGQYWKGIPGQVQREALSDDILAKTCPTNRASRGKDPLAPATCVLGCLEPHPPPRMTVSLYFPVLAWPSRLADMLRMAPGSVTANVRQGLLPHPLDHMFQEAGLPF